MFKKFISFGLFLAFVLSAPSATVFANPTTPSSNDPELICPLPPPATVNVANVTSNHADASWSNVIGAVMYQVRLYDVTTGVSNTPFYTTATSWSFNGLASENTYRVYVGATACNLGQIGAENFREFTTPGIIIDDIAQMPTCTPDHDITVAPNSATTIPLPTISNTIPPQEFLYAKISVDGSNPTYAIVALWQALWNNTLVRAYTSEYAANGVERTPPNTNGNVTPSDAASYNSSATGQLAFTIQTAGASFGTNMAAVVSNKSNTNTLTISYCAIHHGPKPGPGTHIESDTPTANGTDEDPTLLLSNDDPNPVLSDFVAAAPNPFSGSTTIQYYLGEDGPVGIILYSTLGQPLQTLVSQEQQSAGVHVTELLNPSLPKGLYYLVMQTAKGRHTITLIKN